MDLLVKSPERMWLDPSGQWWYRYGTKGLRVKAFIQHCQRCKRPYVGCPLKRGTGRQTRHCSRECGVKASYERNEHPMGWRGPNARSWRGGRLLNRSGYVAIYAPDHPSVQGTQRKYVLEHRLVMEQQLGRLLLSHEQVHHRNGLRNDNRPENLELWVHQQPSGQRPHEQRHCPTCTCNAGHH